MWAYNVSHLLSKLDSGYWIDTDNRQILGLIVWMLWEAECAILKSRDYRFKDLAYIHESLSKHFSFDISSHSPSWSEIDSRLGYYARHPNECQMLFSQVTLKQCHDAESCWHLLSIYRSTLSWCQETKVKSQVILASPIDHQKSYGQVATHRYWAIWRFLLQNSDNSYKSIFHFIWEVISEIGYFYFAWSPFLNQSQIFARSPHTRRFVWNIGVLNPFLSYISISIWEIPGKNNQY